MKTCFKCGQSKPLTEFYAHPRCRQGTLNKCKQCAKIDAALHRANKMKDPAWIAKERERQRLKEAKRRAAGTASKKKAEDRNAWRKRNVIKGRAHVRVGHALRNGVLLRQPCEVCGSTKVQAHHDDYARPLDVRWLCAKHHAKHHLRLRLNELGVAA